MGMYGVDMKVLGSKSLVSDSVIMGFDNEEDSNFKLISSLKVCLTLPKGSKVPRLLSFLQGCSG